jgi:hypothetical protein
VSENERVAREERRRAQSAVAAGIAALTLALLQLCEGEEPGMGRINT